MSIAISTNAQPWIDAGYEIFALHGPEAIKIERLAREVGISKSSFYHHFADLAIFHETLLGWHLARAKEIAGKAAECKNMIPDIVLMFVEIKQDLLFNRQLRIHRTNVSYQLCYERANSLVQNEFFHLWADFIGMNDQKLIAKNILDIVTDIFYQRINNDNFNYEWMIDFLAEIDVFLKDIIKASGVSTQL